MAYRPVASEDNAQAHRRSRIPVVSSEKPGSGRHGLLPRKVTLASYDGKRVAVVLSIQGENRVVCGSASWSRDATLGEALRIRVDQPDDLGMPEILLAQETWEGAVQPDTEYGCDVCVRLP
jgi:hypothetical protein